MAGAGWRSFTAGAVLTAAQVQTYLQDQTVQVFANSAARSSALGTAVSQGMVSFDKSVNERHIYDGTSWTKEAPAFNAITNGAFDIWQRGTSFTNPANLTFTADRIGIYFDGSGATRTVSRQANTATIGAFTPDYFIRFDHSVAGTGAANNLWYHRIENVGTFAGQTVTFSIYAKAATTTVMPKISIDQNFGSGGSATVTTDLATSISVSTTWTRYTYTVTLPSISGKTIGAGNYLGIEVRMPLNATFTLDFSQLQIDAGSVATPFKRNAPSIGAEKSACSWYTAQFQSLTHTAVSGQGIAGSTTIAYITIPFSAPLRTNPTSVEWSALNLTDGGSNYAVTSLTFLSYNGNSVLLQANVASGLTQFRTYMLQQQNSTTSYLRLPAEL